jgi:hypothetical protein
MGLVFCAAVVGCAAAASAAPIIDLGSYSITQGTTQSISINVSDSGSAFAEDIEGMDLKLQIGAGTGTTPAIDSIDLLTGTVFSSIVTSSDIDTPSGGNLPQYMLRDLITNSAGEYVNANGLLATVVLDATGATPGVYAFDLTSSKDPGSDTEFFNGDGVTVPATFGNGTITVTAVPEPASAALLLTGSVIFIRRRRVQ